MRYLVIFLSLLLSGCVIKDIGNTVKYTVQGEYYLEQKKYAQGAETFEKALRRTPNNAQVCYFYGRFLLVEKRHGKALPLLKKAALLKTKNSEYLFWLGIAYGENNFIVQERSSYQRALQLDPDHVEANVHLAHNFLKAADYRSSLIHYKKALRLSPYHPQALYNRGIIYKKLERTPEEKLAWLIYLDYYPSGRFARIATDRLNVLGDYSYQNHRLGLRTVTLTEIGFSHFTAEIQNYSKASLNLVGTTVSNLNNKQLNVIVYQLNDIDLAKKRALAIKTYLYEKYPQLQKSHRIITSWFDTAEKRIVSRKTVILDETVLFFLTEQLKIDKRTKPKYISARKTIKR